MECAVATLAERQAKGDTHMADSSLSPTSDDYGVSPAASRAPRGGGFWDCLASSCPLGRYRAILGRDRLGHGPGQHMPTRRAAG